MIVFELVCRDRHRFEGWFASANEFESQKSRGLLSCPVCSGSGIEKLLTAKIGKLEAEPAHDHAQTPVAPTAQPRNIQEIIDYMLLNTENVGERFPDEARRIHRKEAPQRSIRGVATGEETRELLEEGIAVMPLPVPPRKDWH
ncbi:MAG TPA: DUF1178 family protein [Burkholderiales bacterium]